MRGFAAGVLARYEQVTRGELEASAAAQADRQACLQLGAVFLGEDAGYETVGAWNTGGGLPALLRGVRRYPLDGTADDRQLVARLFALFAQAQ
ncbi:hypothetical protein METHB2_960002 [Candidatus Methylobacter favarea]|uniref:Uncharacterized protein n=1 Tax=Candidatus Methylobacter favarea TaxID=2707345 RepID=A0A8S0Y771_9GAMM|nr:hypothetical protein METHB2_960002 [Candidatus Methylobacter favarea]